MISRASKYPERVPLSFAQRRLWFLSQFETLGATYNIKLALRLTGVMDRKAFKSALDDVVGRHESLRTLFTSIDGEPFQLILPPREADVKVKWSEATSAEASQVVTRACRYVFRLAEEIPIRCEVFSTGTDEYVVVLLVHHIACDGWSLEPLSRDLGVAYTARLAGTEPTWEDLPVQYADYAMWQYELLGTEDNPDSLLAQQSEFWRSALAGLPEELALPTDRPRPATVSNRGGWADFNVSAEAHAGLIDLARAAGVTPFMVVQAGLAALLTRLGAGTDIPLGVPVAGRPDQALHDLVGFFVNTLVLRTDTGGDPSFHELLDRTRDTDLAAFENQDIPFERIVEIINPARSPSRHPLFQVMLAFQNAGDSTPGLPGLEVQELDVPGETAKFDLSFTVQEQFAAGHAPCGLRGTLSYARDLFDPMTAGLLAERFARVLEALVVQPGMRISQVDLLSPQERNQLLAHWNDTTTEVPHGIVPELFERQAEATPDAIAVTCGDNTVTYRQLNTRVNQLAFELLAKGLRPEERVAVIMPRSIDSIAALLAVFKAGGVYLPVDFSAPAAWIAPTVTDAAPACLITAGEEVLPDGVVPRIALDDEATAAAIAEQPEGNITDGDRRAALLPRHAAYVIYTSGSTGRPKGVIIEHRSLANLWHHYRATIYADHLSRTGSPRARVASTSPMSFDACWAPILSMCAGHELHMLDEENRRDPALLVAYLRRHSVDMLDTAPGYAAELTEFGLLSADPETGTPSLKTLIAGGEAVPTTLWERVRDSADTLGINIYGPTENTVSSLACEFTVADSPVLGIPLANVRAYVTDSDLQLVPLGTVGELYLEGAQLARGYLGQPDLTAERFLPCPFAGYGARMYRTGDLVRRRPDGLLQFMGRTDGQVKLRGFRVELGEIEAALERYPGVVQAVALLREDRRDDKRLVSYVAATREIEPSAIREYIASVLPDYMVPAAVMVLDALPLTANGKVDRRALPAPNLSREVSQPPRTAQEEEMCRLFADILGISEIGIDDDFFQLGGHSLLAVRLISRIRNGFLTEISLSSFFRNPTVIGVVALLNDDSSPEGGPDDSSLIVLNENGSRLPLFCIYPITALRRCYAALTPHLIDRPVYGLSDPRIGKSDFQIDDVSQLADEYIACIRRVQPVGPYHLLGWSLGGNIAHAIACALQGQGESVALLALMDSSAPGADNDAHAANADAIVRLVAQETGRYHPDAEIIESVSRVTAQIVRSVRAESTGRFEGPVSFFTAALDRSGAEQMWSPFISGPITNYDIQTGHYDMIQRESLSQIGPILARIMDGHGLASPNGHLPMIISRSYAITRDAAARAGGISAAVAAAHVGEPLRWFVSAAEPAEFKIEAIEIIKGSAPPVPEPVAAAPTGAAIAVSLIPTGIGCEIGGYAGDAGPATALLAAACDYLVTNPNALNSSNFINSISNVIYTEGYSLDLFARAEIDLHVPRANRIGVIIEHSSTETLAEIFNVINTARAVHGIDIVDCVITEEPIGTCSARGPSGAYTGKIGHPEVLVAAAQRLIASGATALAVTTEVHGLSADNYARHFSGEHPNPVGGAEAIISHLLTRIFRVPAAHAPIINFTDAHRRGLIVDARSAGEFISKSGLACVLLGLRRAPYLASRPGRPVSARLSADDIMAIVAPATALGSAAVLSAASRGIPVIAVRNNNTILNVTGAGIGLSGVVEVDDYVTAAGTLLALRSGISLQAVRRPLQTLGLANMETKRQLNYDLGPTAKPVGA